MFEQSVLLIFFFFGGGGMHQCTRYGNGRERSWTRMEGQGEEVKREESDKDGGTAYSVMSTCGLLTTFPMVCLGPSFKLNLPLPSVNVNCGVT